MREIGEAIWLFLPAGVASERKRYARVVTPIAIQSGRVIVYRLFDVADEIDLSSVRDVRAGARGPASSIIVRDAPATIDLGPATLRLGTQQHSAAAVARVWRYGAVSLQFHLPIEPGTDWKDLLRFAASLQHDNDIDSIAAQRVAEVQHRLGAALKLPHAPAAAEDYIIYLLQSIEGATASQLRERADIPALLLGEPETRLSEETRRAILGNAITYAEQDLTVVDWNSALVVDPSGGEDVADILEFANTHAVEFRYFDDLLDERLERLYDQLEGRRPSLLRRDFEHLSHEASSLFLEVTDYVERVENSLKFVGNPHLARVFRMAAERFDLREWESSVERKLGALARTAELLHNEVNARRSHVLEIIIILLILYEIVSAALRWG